MKKCFTKLFFAGALSMSFALCADVPQPYASVQNLPQTPYYVQDGYTCYSLINANGSAVIIDVESADGGVARYIAQQQVAGNLPSVKVVYSVNAWQSQDPSQKRLFQRFLSNVKQENTAQLIVPIRMSSQEAAQAMNVTADLISVVGGNDAQGVYNDILAWYPHLANMGIITGNNWYDPSVQMGVTKAAAAIDLSLKVNGNVWYFQKGM